MSVRCGKKRKLVVDHEAEKSLYGSFVSAANAVSTLYSQAVQQQRRASAQASRQALERVVTFLLSQNPGSEVVSKAVMLQFLQSEYESIEGGEHLPHVFPAPQISLAGTGPGGAGGGEPQPEQPGFSGAGGGGGGGKQGQRQAGYFGASPARRQHSGGMMDGMDASSDGCSLGAHHHHQPAAPQGQGLQPGGLHSFGLGGFHSAPGGGGGGGFGPTAQQ
eukprot:XP_001701532.1 predicted protein [Chlamydomonas reinhardtii]